MGHQGFKSRTNTKRNYYSKSLEKGTCIYCSKKSKEGSTRCQYHIDYEKRRSKKKCVEVPNKEEVET